MNTVPTWLASGHNRTPLILLHGMGSTASVWLPQLDAFGPSRQVIAWTMPGYGQSPLLPALSWRNLAAALANMLDTLSINK
ncbi:MAG TPA: alpha/beta hydrolase, partial [Pusillimonas sp.]|nr:alpha/beta hydrolase [Pusillimonas sp.]